MKKTVTLAFIAVVIFVAFIFTRNDGKSETLSGKLRVTASFYPLYFFAERIGGDKAEVVNITPAGAEPHDYEPTAREIARIENSDLVIINGAGLEPWSGKIKDNLRGKQTTLVIAGDGIATQEAEGEGEKITDPHVWLSPALTAWIAEKITSGFVKANPENTEYYTANAAALKSELIELKGEYAIGLQNCARRDFITAHNAFGYLASAYGLNEIPIAGLSPEAEPSSKELAELAQFAQKRGVRYIFFEKLASPKLSETLAREIGAETLILNPLEGLSAEDAAAGKNYFTEMRENLMNLKTALECRV